ncbi:MAG: tripartite tricarboxylate transporter substrate binding protein [Betaproteobacteria bacterium]|nr:tripartite tricarboxylate transporter substrate binding protein [Betaproteobacteria bacterium]
MMRNARATLAQTFAVLLAAFAATSAFGQPWPSKPLRLVVPLGAGGNADAVARAVAQGLSDQLGQPVVVENRPGAAGNIGMEHVARAAADGYTILFAVTGITINPALYRMSFDPATDLAPVVQLNKVNLALFARAGLAANSPREVLALARQPGVQLSCASTGGATQLGCGLFEVAAGVPVTQVLYKGPVQALTDLASGNVDLAVDIPQAARPFIALGRVKAIGTSGPHAERTVVGNLPPLSELHPAFVLPGWHGLFVPAGTPPVVIDRINTEVNELLKTATLRAKFESAGLVAVGGSVAAFAQLVQQDRERYRRIADITGLSHKD